MYDSQPRSCSAHRSRIRRIPQDERPRGVAVVMVLGLLAITLAISYATLRGQSTTSQLARNNSRALDARVAAQSGLAAAIRRISESSWGGVSVPLSANVSNHSWYQVTFTTGDAKLQSSDPQYGEFAYRLTIDSIGYASDPLNPAVRSEHKCRTVVQLLRKKLQAQPANWNTLCNHSVFQFSNKDAFVQFPVRIDGPTTIMGKLIFCNEYPNSTTPRNQYLSDLNARRVAGLGDDRPFPSTITLRGLLTTQDLATVTLLTTNLGILAVDTLASPVAPVAHPGTVLTYRLYPGGKEYTPPVIQNAYGNPIQNVTLRPDPITNPLGVFRSNGSLNIQSNVLIQGTLVSDSGGGEVQIYGTNVAIKPVNLPALYGSNSTLQLPTTLVADDLRINSGSDVQIEGMAMVWDEFELKSGLATSKFALRGNLVTSALQLRGRSPWVLTPTTWSNDISMFNLQKLNLADPNRSLYFPDYLQKQRSFVVKPTLTFAANSGGVTPHWHDWSQPVYQADPADQGLRWEVVRWEDNL